MFFNCYGFILHIIRFVFVCVIVEVYVGHYQTELEDISNQHHFSIYIILLYLFFPLFLAVLTFYLTYYVLFLIDEEYFSLLRCEFSKFAILSALTILANLFLNERKEKALFIFLFMVLKCKIEGERRVL